MGCVATVQGCVETTLQECKGCVKHCSSACFIALAVQRARGCIVAVQGAGGCTAAVQELWKLHCSGKSALQWEVALLPCMSCGSSIAAGSECIAAVQDVEVALEWGERVQVALQQCRECGGCIEAGGGCVALQPCSAGPDSPLRERLPGLQRRRLRGRSTGPAH